MADSRGLGNGHLKLNFGSRVLVRLKAPTLQARGAFASRMATGRYLGPISDQSGSGGGWVVVEGSDPMRAIKIICGRTLRKVEEKLGELVEHGWRRESDPNGDGE